MSSSGVGDWLGSLAYWLFGYGWRGLLGRLLGRDLVTFGGHFGGCGGALLLGAFLRGVLAACSMGLFWLVGRE